MPEEFLAITDDKTFFIFSKTMTITNTNNDQMVIFLFKDYYRIGFEATGEQISSKAGCGVGYEG